MDFKETLIKFKDSVISGSKKLAEKTKEGVESISQKMKESAKSKAIETTEKIKEEAKEKVKEKISDVGTSHKKEAENEVKKETKDKNMETSTIHEEKNTEKIENKEDKKVEKTEDKTEIKEEKVEEKKEEIVEEEVVVKKLEESEFVEDNGPEIGAEENAITYANKLVALTQRIFHLNHTLEVSLKNEDYKKAESTRVLIVSEIDDILKELGEVGGWKGNDMMYEAARDYLESYKKDANDNVKQIIILREKGEKGGEEERRLTEKSNENITKISETLLQKNDEFLLGYDEFGEEIKEKLKEENKETNENSDEDESKVDDVVAGIPNSEAEDVLSDSELDDELKKKK